MPELNTINPDHITFQYEELHFNILGGIRLEGLDRLRVTIKAQFNRQAIRHNLDLYNDTQLDKLIKKAAERLEISSLYMREAIEELVNLLEDYRLNQIKEQEVDNNLKPKQLTEEEIKEATDFLKADDLLAKTNELIGKSGVIGEVDNRLLMYLIFTSRKQEQPLHIISLGSSGSGKTHLQEKVAELIPEEETLSITTLSENAFYYFNRTELKNKLILIEDLDGAESSLYPIRELQSKKKISKTITLKDNGGKPKTTTLIVEGPVCVAGCTTRESIYEDNSNRSFLIYLDESPKQDEKVMAYQRSLSAGKVNDKERQSASDLLSNCQRLLEPVKVVNPYAELLKLPTEIFKPRRTNSHYLHFIEVVTFYHQWQRHKHVNKETGEIYIETTLEDIESTNNLLREVLLRKSDELTGACRNYLESIKSYLEQEGKTQYSNREIRKTLRVNESNQKRYTLNLLNNYYIKRVKGSKSKGFLYEITSYEEYKKLKEQVGNVLDETLEQLKKVRQSTSDRSNVVQKKNEPLNKQQISTVKSVVHKYTEKGQGGIKINDSPHLQSTSGGAANVVSGINPALCGNTQSQSMTARLGQGAQNTLQQITNDSKDNPGKQYNAKKISEITGKSPRTESRYLKQLFEAGLLKREFAEKTYVYRLIEIVN